MRIVVTDTGSYPYNDSYFKVDPELGIKKNTFGLWHFQIIDEKKFFLAVVKYGIQFKNLFPK